VRRALPYQEPADAGAASSGGTRRRVPSHGLPLGDKEITSPPQTSGRLIDIGNRSFQVPSETTYMQKCEGGVQWKTKWKTAEGGLVRQEPPAEQGGDNGGAEDDAERRASDHSRHAREPCVKPLDLHPHGCTH
jgi:hypothetical protein